MYHRLININDITSQPDIKRLIFQVSWALFPNLYCISPYPSPHLSIYLSSPSSNLSPIYSLIHPPVTKPDYVPCILMIHLLCNMYLWIRFTHPYSLRFTSLYDENTGNICCFCSGLRHLQGIMGHHPN